jgi:plasmid rolling circle replication initiator protein Rep
MQKTTARHTQKSSALGINAETAVALQPRGFQFFDSSQKFLTKVDSTTGEIAFFTESKDGKELPKKTYAQVRSERFSLKSICNQILPDERVAQCCRTRFGNDNVSIWKSKDHEKTHYKGLYTCSSPWMCPVCASKIAERRRLELITANQNAKNQGLSVYMATFTVPHGLGDDINLILDRMTAAWRFMTMSVNYKRLRKQLGIVGTIRALETTYGSNGFHPHYHVIFFTRSPVDLNQFQTALYEVWLHACSKRSLSLPSKERGVIVQDGQKAASYLSKWGIEDEMTKGHIKTSKSINGMTPWDLLRDVLETGSTKSKKLFYVYAKAFKGRRQLYWSNGLKQLLSISECSDEEIAAQQDDSALLVAEITPEQWRSILFTRSEAATLEVAEKSPHLLDQFLMSLVEITNLHFSGSEREGARRRATPSEPPENKKKASK